MHDYFLSQYNVIAIVNIKWVTLIQYLSDKFEGFNRYFDYTKNFSEKLRCYLEINLDNRIGIMFKKKS